MDHIDLCEMIEETLKPYICKYKNCSDGEDRQYPECDMFWKTNCPMDVYIICDFAKDLASKLSGLINKHTEKIDAGEKLITLTCSKCGEKFERTKAFPVHSECPKKYCNGRLHLLPPGA